MTGRLTCNPTQKLRRIVRPLSEGYVTLTMWTTDQTDWRGQTRIAYKLRHKGKTIFEGADFCGSPMRSDDSDATIAALLGFLSLRPGDTDKEYFDSYTPEQLDWAQTYGEELYLIKDSLDPEA